MDRRTFIALTAVVPLAGCLGSDPIVDELLEAGESTTFEADAGDELDVTVASGDDGVVASIEHTSGDGERWEWELGADEEESGVIEIGQDGEHVVAVEDGSAFITVE